MIDKVYVYKEPEDVMKTVDVHCCTKVEACLLADCLHEYYDLDLENYGPSLLADLKYNILKYGNIGTVNGLNGNRLLIQLCQ